MLTQRLSIAAVVVATAACTNGIDAGPLTAPDAALADQTAVTFEGTLDNVGPVPFGGPPDTACNYTQSMDHLVLDLLIKPSGAVIGGAMQNHNVEAIVGTCQFAPAAPTDVSYALANVAADQLTFTGAADNHPQASLAIQLTQTAPHTYAAALTIHRTDLVGTFAWTVTANITLTPKP